MSVLDKAVLVIDTLGRASGPMRLGAVAESVALPKSSAHRLLNELTALGVVRRAGDGEYALGYRLVQWGILADRSIGLRPVAEPIMTQLRDELSESVHLYVPEDYHRVCVLVVDSPHTLRPVESIGKPLPLGYGAAGKLLLAHSEERIRRTVAERLPHHRGRDLPDDEELELIAKAGVAVSEGELEDGLTAIATTLRAPGGGVFGVLSVTGASTRMPADRLPAIETSLAAAAERLSRAFGA